EHHQHEVLRDEEPYLTGPHRVCHVGERCTRDGAEYTVQQQPEYELNIQRNREEESGGAVTGHIGSLAHHSPNGPNYQIDAGDQDHPPHEAVRGQQKRIHGSPGLLNSCGSTLSWPLLPVAAAAAAEDIP